MGIIRTLYWGVAYTTGIACATAFTLRYVQKRDGLALKFALFLFAFTSSIVFLGIREAFIGTDLATVAGCLALSGASLIAVTFPGYALGFDVVKRRRATARVLRIAGFALAILNPLSLVVPFPYWSFLYALTISLLGFAIFAGMSWLSRGSVQWHSRKKNLWMASLFVFFGLVLFLDFFRGFIPPLRVLGDEYWLFPAFSAYLNVFLIYHHVTEWTKAAIENSSGKEPMQDMLGRHGISKRETEVLSLLRRGRTYLEIADDLCVSLATVKSHLSHLYDKTGTRNKVELINLLYDSPD